MGEEVLLVQDLQSAPPVYFHDYPGRAYQSFILVPVRAGRRSYGSLMVDSDRPHSLTEIDVGYTILLAGILAAGIAQLRDAEFPTRQVPEQARYRLPSTALRAPGSHEPVLVPTQDERENIVTIPLVSDDDRAYLTGKLAFDEYLDRVVQNQDADELLAGRKEAPSYIQSA
jgi:hypothetical protein